MKCKLPASQKHSGRTILQLLSDERCCRLVLNTSTLYEQVFTLSGFMMQLIRKLSILADAAKYDASCASSGSKRAGTRDGIGNVNGMGICHSYAPDGRCISLLKILLTNYCIYDCQYCVNRVTSDTPRARFSVDEVVKLTLDFYRRNYIEGLFLSSGIIQDANYTMEQLIAVARSLREEHQYHGYIHLKTIPGADPRLIDEAGRLADRLSVNIELPTDDDLRELAPDKKRPQIEQSMTEIGLRIIESKEDSAKGMKARFAPAGQSTQMIVGATPTTDRAILDTSTHLYTRQRLKRVYYSAFSPIPHADARLPSAAPPMVREHRLYQADWLIRFYGFNARELTTPEVPNLDGQFDPKLAWALRHPHLFPLDVNRASREELLRIPGLGVRNVNRLLQVRKHHQLRLADLKRLRLAWNKAQWFVVAADHHPGIREVGPELFAPEPDARPVQRSLFD